MFLVRVPVLMFVFVGLSNHRTLARCISLAIWALKPILVADWINSPYENRVVIRLMSRPVEAIEI
jgi:hypothetical protein